MSHTFQQDFRRLAQHYAGLLGRHGDSPHSAQWSDRASQERRLEVLAQVADLRTAKVLDFGCGTGHLLAYLRSAVGFAGEYVGYDLSEELIGAAAAKFPEARFEARDVLTEGVPEDFDYVLISGVFNNRVGDNWGLLTTLLRQLFPRARRALAFNALSTYVDFLDPELFYLNPEDALRFCKENLSPCVTLRHDYQIRPGVAPYEFTLYAYAADVPPRKEFRP